VMKREGPGEHRYGTLALGLSTLEICEPGSWGDVTRRALEGPERRNSFMGTLLSTYVEAEAETVSD